jgi:hypothetical protein
MTGFMGSPGLNPSVGIIPTLVKAAIAASADKFFPISNFSANRIAYSPWFFAEANAGKGASSLQQVKQLSRPSLHVFRTAHKISSAMTGFMGSPGLNPSVGIIPTLVKAAIAASADKFSPIHNFSANWIAYSPWEIEDAEAH